MVCLREATKKPAFAWVITSAAFLIVASSLALLPLASSPSTVGVTGDLQFAGTAPLPTQAQGLTGTWTNISPTYAPAPFAVPAMAYVPTLHGSILFGGSLQSSETWRYRSDEMNWSQLSPQSAPPPMMGASMAYDSGVGKVVLFGGIWVRSDHSICAGNDTWLDATARSGRSSPSALHSTSESRWTVRWRAETAAGKVGRRIEPSGHVIRTCLVRPSFWGTSAPMKQRTAK